MSDIEEPEAKMAKLDDTVEGEEMDNGQEEWLSEEILTDDDYHPAADQDQSDSNANTSQEEGNTDSMASQDAPNSTGENIERTLNNLENSTPSTQHAELPEELGAFLIRKTDRRVVDEPPTKELESELDESTKQSEDDGNDTDDLLRMLGDDNIKKLDGSASQSSQSMQPKEVMHSSDEEDDEYIFEKKAKKMIMLKGGLLQKAIASRAVPEDTSDREADNHVSSKVSSMSKLKVVKLGSRDGRSRKMVRTVAGDISDRDEDSVQKHPKPTIKRETSSDEAMTMKRMFNMHHTKVLSAGRGLAPRGRGINAVKTVTNRVISIDPKTGTNISPPVSSKTQVKFTKLPAKHAASVHSNVKSPARPTDPQHRSHNKTARDEVDDDELNDLSQEFNEVDSEGDGDDGGGQRLMRPERMDEEVPTDAESHSEDDSYYDEMPSSESEDADDWFTLDIRTEKATEYIPMLGDDAKALLTAEQQRAAARLGALKQSASALVAGRRSLAAQLRVARTSIAQLDAAIAQ